MKIAIDISQIVHQGSGVARYTHGLIASLLKYDQKNQYVFFFSSLRQRVPQNLKQQIKEKHFLKEFFLPPTLLEILWNKFHIIPIETFIGKVDIFISSDWVEPPAKMAKKITVIHDLIALKYPKESHPLSEFSLNKLNFSANIVAVQKRRLNRVKKESSLIIADSYATKHDIITLLKIPENKIEVVYPPVEITIPNKNQIKKTMKKYQIKRPFILTVGKHEPRKNLPRLINAFKKTKLNDVDLIIVGSQGWDKTNYELQITNYKNIKFLGFIPDEDLYSLYNSAMFFIYPSIYEGFGYPVVEAMKMGCPVATSNTSSLKEIADNCCLLFNPYSEEDIANKILSMSQNKNLRLQLKEKGKKRSELFSSQKFANDLIKIFGRSHLSLSNYDNRSRRE